MKMPLVGVAKVERGNEWLRFIMRVLNAHKGALVF